MVVFDLDGTLVRYHGVEFESSWGAIAAAAGVQEASDRLLREYLPRPEAYREWVEQDAALLTGVPVARVAAAVFPPPYAEGVVEAVARLRGRYRMGILSSGVDLVANRVRDELDMAFAVANRLEIRDGIFTGGGEMIVDLWTKHEALERVSREYGVPLAEVCFVGDHLNDAVAMERVGLGIAYNPKHDDLIRAADRVTSAFGEIPDLIEAYERQVQ